MSWLRHLGIALLLVLAVPAAASETNGTVLSSDTFAWGDIIGWINFAPTDGTSYQGLQITDDAVTGFAWSRDNGWINFSPSSSGQGVTNTEEGVLGGSAWVSNLGWISMDGVTINDNGEFTGIAGVAGTDTARISFDCSNCSVKTDWRPASVREDTTDDDDTGGGDGTSGDRRRLPESDGTAETTPGPFQGIVDAVLGNPTFAAGVAQAAGATVTDADGDGIPDYLFDILLRLEKTVLVPGEDIIANVSFVSFGTLPTPVEAVYTVRASDGTVLATIEDAFIVETERAESKTFSGLNLAPGVYSVHLRVVYGAGTVEEFEQAFAVAAKSGGCWYPWPLSLLANHVPPVTWLIVRFGCWFPWIILLIIAAAIATWRFVRRLRKEKEDYSVRKDI